jgi:DNA-binding NarL/FixJ family response regulator
MAIRGGVDAVLSPEVEVLDAEGDAKMESGRRLLRAAVRTIEHARRARRAEPARALESWKGPGPGRWSVVDHVESDGERYVLVRENRPGASGPSALTQSECCVVTMASRGLTTKEVAYALGLSDATVRVLIMRAARRCGARSREELFRVFRDARASEMADG